MSSLFDKLDGLGLRPIGDPNERLPASQMDVEEVEKLFGLPFPSLYSEFLLRYGASGFNGFASFKVPDNWNELTGGAPTDVGLFFGIDIERDYSHWNLGREIKNARRNDVASHFLPICVSDYFGDYSPHVLLTMIYLSCGEQDYGHVYALTWTQTYDDGELATVQVCQTALHIADSFENFLDRFDVISQEEFYASLIKDPFFIALHAGDVSLLQSMIDAGEIETYRSKGGYTLLESVITSRLAWPVELILKYTAPSDRALWLAITYGCVDAIRLLIAHGVDVNAPNPFNTVSTEWSTPLIQAVRSDFYDKKYEMVRLLVEGGADIGLRDSHDKNALDYVHRHNQKMRDIIIHKS